MNEVPAAGEHDGLLQRTVSHSGPTSGSFNGAPLKSNWPIIRVVLGCIIFATANFIFLPSLLFSGRVRVCASVYERRPDLIAPPRSPCELPIVEKELATFDAVSVTLIQVFKILATSYLLPVLSRSRRTASLLCVAAGLMNVAPWILLPIGFPYGPKAEDMLIGPTVSLGILIFMTSASSFLGRDMLGIMVFQALAVDVSTPETRSRNLTWINSSIMFSLCFAPALSSLLITLLPAIRAGWLIQMSTTLSADDSQHTNVIPFVGSAVLYLATAAWMILVIPETAVRSTAVDDLKQASEPRSAKDLISFASLRVFIPRKMSGASSSDQSDWRLLRLAIAAHGQTAGMAGLTSLVFYCGYFLHWGAVAIGLLLSWIGLIRALVLLVACPLVLLACERTIARPALIRGLDKESLRKLADQEPADEELEEEALSSAHEVRRATHRSTYRAGERQSAHEFEAATVATRDDQLRDATGLTEVRAEDAHHRALQKRALSLWRAKADLFVVKASFISDFTGWIITAWGAQYLTSGPIILGEVLVSLGAASAPTLTSTAIAIVNEQEEQVFDSKAAELHAPHSETPQADVAFKKRLRKELKQKQADAVIGGLQILDQFGILWSGPCNNFLYASTLTSLPGASFLFCAFMFATSIVAMWGLTIDANVPGLGALEAYEDGSRTVHQDEDE